MRCSVCGADNLEGSIYCEDCGARLPAASAAAAPVTQEASAVHPVAAPVAAPIPPVPTPVAAAPVPEVSAGANQNCGGCGAINPPGVAFCEDCGASLSETFTSIEATPTSQPVVYDAPTQVSAPTPIPVVAPVVPVMAAPTPRLVHSSGKEFPLLKDLILMGRRSPVDGIYPEVDLTELDVESYISRKHGRMVRSDQGYVFEDLGSSNGSFYNGARLQPNVQTPLKEGDSIRLGKTELFLRL